MAFREARVQNSHMSGVVSGSSWLGNGPAHRPALLRDRIDLLSDGPIKGTAD